MNDEKLKDERLEIRLPYGLKELFILWCMQNETTPSERLRKLMEWDVKELEQRSNSQ